jgi:type IV secretion system protein VirB10
MGAAERSAAAALDELQRRRAPVLVVDLSEPSQSAPAAPVPSSAKTGGGEASPLNENERFEARVGGGDVNSVTATQLRNLDTLVPQGAIIPAVLETAINSDLPGYARAVVSRDVLSFDGANVLIPRGSRLIGQYKSGVALGQSRAFVIWTRVIRPDGVSVQISSPGGDSLGRGGLAGHVDNHFFVRFGGSILLSVINAAVTSLANSHNGAQIIIGSGADASSIAAAALQKDNGVSPTVTVEQGAAVRVFVARDLDFSEVSSK